MGVELKGTRKVLGIPVEGGAEWVFDQRLMGTGEFERRPNEAKGVREKERMLFV